MLYLDSKEHVRDEEEPPDGTQQRGWISDMRLSERSQTQRLHCMIPFIGSSRMGKTSSRIAVPWTGGGWDWPGSA